MLGAGERPLRRIARGHKIDASPCTREPGRGGRGAGPRSAGGPGVSDKQLEKVKFLIIDDNAFMRTIVRSVLNALNANQVKEAADGVDALKIMKNFQPDIIIADWEMRPVDGIEFVRMVRIGSDSRDPFVPIIMLSGHSENARVTVARDAGINEYLVKPISASTLFSRIEAVIERPRPFVRAKDFFGPDRRRRDVGYRGEERRKAQADGDAGGGDGEVEIVTTQAADGNDSAASR